MARQGRLLVLAVGGMMSAAPAQEVTPLLGYGVASSSAERVVETRLRESVSAASIATLHAALTRRPHPAGTVGGREVAEGLSRTLRRFGLDVEVLEYQSWLSHLRQVRVDIVEPGPRRLSVREPPLEIDPDTTHAGLGSAFIAYSASADVTAPLVYVNYGLPADYEHLQALGVSVKGRIALARYARSHRAVKVHTAERAGAAGVILYSDPADDGAIRGDVWPTGYWRGDQTPQRGNAKYSWFWHGDPLTPGQPALAGVARLDPKSAPTLPKIPVAVLSSGEARHLLSALGGPAAPEGFRGGVKADYRVGPGPARVRLAVRMQDGLRPIRNVVARLRGSEQPERMILLGAHHDAWTFGGVDPGTGAAALLEVARALGQLAASGWRPKRTIGIAFWDAEEYGLIGSTEYAEHKRRELQEQLMTYVNTDMYMAGRFDPGGVPSLRDLVIAVARDVPQGTSNVYEQWRDVEVRPVTDGSRPDAASFQPDLKTLGSGADFVPFQDHLGVPTLSIEFIGANGYGFGTYHSNYDTRAYAERVADPGFTQGVTLSRVLGTLAMRMAGADVLPFRYSHYAAQLGTDLTRVGDRAGEAHRARLADLIARVARIRQAALTLERVIDDGLASRRLPDARTASLNDRLARLEQQLTDDEGDSDTRWYRHVVHGWNIYSLYDGQPFPGIESAIQSNDPARIAHQLGRLDRALQRMLAEIEEAIGEAGAGQ